jgi:hypothetical protein
MPRGRARKFELVDEPLVRVVVYLERRTLEDLAILARHRFGGVSRSALVRQAVDREVVRHADLVLRARWREARVQREAEQLARARELSAEDRERRARQELVSDALKIARGERDAD